MSSLNYELYISIDHLDTPEGWLSINVGTSRYSYGNSVRGMFPVDHVADQQNFLLNAIPTMLEVSRMAAEAERTEQEAADAEAARVEAEQAAQS